jgi:hypothetical protein
MLMVIAMLPQIRATRQHDQRFFIALCGQYRTDPGMGHNNAGCVEQFGKPVGVQISGKIKMLGLVTVGADLAKDRLSQIFGDIIHNSDQSIKG